MTAISALHVAVNVIHVSVKEGVGDMSDKFRTVRFDVSAIRLSVKLERY